MKNPALEVNPNALLERVAALMEGEQRRAIRENRPSAERALWQAKNLLLTEIERFFSPKPRG